MKTIYLTKGLPASGKSTWVRNLMETNPGTYKRVNKDDLRAMLDSSHWSKHNEKFVLKVRDFIVNIALEDGKHVIVDDTNLHPKHEQRMRDIARAHGARVEVVDHFLDVPIEECIRRDLKRPDSVGEQVIRKMANSVRMPTPEPPRREGFSQCVLVDLDGTLANIDHRNPYDASECVNDELNVPVAETVHALSQRGYRIVYVSGRDGRWRDETVQWMDKHNLPPATLHMRKPHDTRKDAVVKEEMYDTYIRPYKDVLLVLDDRQQVVDFWRSRGLWCFQVAPGDF